VDWRDRGACVGEDPELFFPIGSGGPASRQVAEAKLVCARCTVVHECLDWAVAVGESDGVWGGTTPEERLAIRRRHGVTPVR
jgi:WhiB family redox-sensing transcriptional regulator